MRRDERTGLCPFPSLVTVAILDFMDEKREYYGEEITPREFNEGMCFELADFVSENVPRAEYIRLIDEMFPEMTIDEKNAFEDEYDSIIHALIKYEGKYYDAEVPEGVISLEELPVVKRFRKMYLNG